jgi:hypothetical protein
MVLKVLSFSTKPKTWMTTISTNYIYFELMVEDEKCEKLALKSCNKIELIAFA